MIIKLEPCDKCRNHKNCAVKSFIEAEAKGANPEGPIKVKKITVDIECKLFEPTTHDILTEIGKEYKKMFPDDEVKVDGVEI